MAYFGATAHSQTVSGNLKNMILPKIPIEKKLENKNQTIERKIVSKLINNKNISSDEIKSLRNIIVFYKQLQNALLNFEYSKLDKKEIDELISYIRSVFYYTTLHSYQLQINKLFRIVKNKSILDSNNSIEHKKFLTYPPDHIVKRNNKFNRANSPYSNVFYGSENIETAIFELKPEPGEKITVGEWIPTESNLFKMNFIFHDKVLNNSNHVSSIIKTKHNELVQNIHPMLKEFFSGYMDILGHEFSKPINNHKEYIVSATLSEKIFENNKKSKNDIAGLVYPSVNNNFSSHNIAMKKNIIRHKFKLANVSEFIVLNTFYDAVWDGNLQNGSPIKNLIEANGKRKGKLIDKKIVWE